MSLLIARRQVICCDAADGLEEHIIDEIAPGSCRRDRNDQARTSLRWLKKTISARGPNHDPIFFGG